MQLWCGDEGSHFLCIFFNIFARCVDAAMVWRWGAEKIKPPTPNYIRQAPGLPMQGTNTKFQIAKIQDYKLQKY